MFSNGTDTKIVAFYTVFRKKAPLLFLVNSNSRQIIFRQAFFSQMCCLKVSFSLVNLKQLYNKTEAMIF